MGGSKGGGGFKGTKGGRSIKYPGNNSTVSPGAGFEWRGQGSSGSGKGNWYNPSTGERWNPDLKHGSPVGPHWDYTDSFGNSFRVYPDGRVEPK